MTLQALIQALKEKRADPVLIKVLDQVDETEEIFSAKEAKQFLRVSERTWQSYLLNGWVVKFYRPHSKRPVYKRSQLSTLLSLSEWGKEEQFFNSY